MPVWAKRRAETMSLYAVVNGLVNGQCTANMLGLDYFGKSYERAHPVQVYTAGVADCVQRMQLTKGGHCAGASGLVIEQGLADKLGLESFGEMYVTGMGGRLLCRFRRGHELSLGAITIQRPLFMQMSLTGVVSGAPGPVTGILG